MNNFWRAIRLTFKYRLTIVITVLCALFLAFFWGANITAVFPLVQISFNGETVGDYWTKEIAAKTDALAEYKIKKAALQDELKGLMAEDGKILLPKTDRRYAEVQKGRLALGKLQRDEQTAEKGLDGLRRAQPYVDRFAPKTPYGTVVVLMLLVIAGTVIKSIFTYIHTYLSTRLGMLGIYELRELFFSKAIHFEVDYYSNNGVADTMSRFTNDTGGIKDGITIFYGKLIREPLKLVVCLIGAALISWQLLLLTLVFIPAVGWMIAWMAKKIKKTVRNALMEMVNMYARIGETFRSIRIIKVFNRERLERAKFRRTNRKNLQKGLKTAKYNALISPMTEIMGIAILVTVILFSAWLVITGETSIWGIPMLRHPLSLGGIILFFGFLIGASDPARRLSDIFSQLQGAVSAADRVYEIIDRENTIPEAVPPKRLRRFEKRIVLEHVDFSYDIERQRISHALERTQKEKTKGTSAANLRGPNYVLHDISLEIPFGETIAIVGRSGCGKSTLLSLIPRFTDPTGGVVSIDDIPLTDVRLFDLRQQIGLITQSPIIFNASVEENIRYGTYGRSFDEVVDAAKRAYAHDFIVNDLEDGYQTNLGPDGARLSGGQMQRITIARAILKDPRILLLDEATSQIDMESERLIHEALKGFIGRRTTIIVTHRLGALPLADRVVVMKEGRIRHVGTHEELMKESSYYQGLFTNPMEQPAHKTSPAQN